MDKTYLKFEQIGMSFRRGQMATEVLRDIDLSIAQGEFVSMIGHSGCGKSTLLNILGGLLKSTTGEVFLEGKVVDEPGPDRAIVFQNHSLLPWLTVYGNVAIAVDKVFGATVAVKMTCSFSTREVPGAAVSVVLVPVACAYAANAVARLLASTEPSPVAWS